MRLLQFLAAARIDLVAADPVATSGRQSLWRSMVARVNRIGGRVSDAMPAPLAAPETTRLRRLRLSLLLLLAAIAALTAIFPWLQPAGTIATTAAALVWQGCALAASVVGIIWVREKNRADNAWLYRDEDER